MNAAIINSSLRRSGSMADPLAGFTRFSAEELLILRSCFLKEFTPEVLVSYKYRPVSTESRSNERARLKALVSKGVVTVVFLGVLLSVYVTSFVAVPGMDFRMFYSAAQMVRQGAGKQLYNLEVQKQFQADFTQQVALVYNYPPVTAFLYVPVSYFSVPIAYLIWVVESMTILALCAFLLNKSLQIFRDGFWAFLLTFVFVPVHLLMLQGQVDLVVLLAYVLAFLAMKSGKDGWSGLALSLGLVKFHLVLPFVLLFLLWKRWRFLAGFGAGATVMLIFSVLISGSAVLVQYPDLLRHLSSIRSAGYAPGAMANIHGLLFLLTGSQEPRMWIVLVLSGVLVFWTSRKTFRIEYGFAAAMVVTLLVSYHLNPHDLVLALLPLAIALRNVRWNSPYGVLLLSIALPVLPSLFLSRHVFALMALPVLAFWVVLMRFPFASTNDSGQGEVAVVGFQNS